MSEGNIAIEHLAGPFTPTDLQRCLRCRVLLAASFHYERPLLPIYPDHYGETGRFVPYEPVWFHNGLIWPTSPDPEKVKIVFCGEAN